jgi:hypothetical protein
MEPLYMIGSGAAVLLLVTHVAQLFWRRRARDDGQYRQLADAFEKQQRDVWNELQALRTEYATSLEDLHERLDFAERLLTQGQPSPGNKEDQATTV